MTAGTRNYAIVTASYWGFTLTDGALRMLVLFHFFKLGYSPFTLSFLFLLYEAAGIAANFLIGGWLAGYTLWHHAYADGRPLSADHRFSRALGIVAGVDGLHVRCLGGRSTGNLRHR